jgi:uncharacterized protein (DUF433 family)
MENPLLHRITLNQNICHGKPCIRGLRYPVEFILELLSAGMSSEDILADYDDLELDDILAALLFATRLTQVKSIYKVIRCTAAYYDIYCQGRCAIPES